MRRRIADVAVSLAPGSNLVFMNSLREDKFDELMNEVVGAREQSDAALPGSTYRKAFQLDPQEFPDINIFHVPGNAANYQECQDLLSVDPKYRFNTAIVLGTQAVQQAGGVAKQLPPHSQDTRVLSILLILRELSQNWDEPLHIITENQEDQTELLAITPRIASLSGTVASIEPDFINVCSPGKRYPQDLAHHVCYVLHLCCLIQTQAIYARALTMTMAYPQMANSILEIFEDQDYAADGIPTVDLINCRDLGLLGSTLPFGAIQHRLFSPLSTVDDGTALAMGLHKAEGGLELAPPLSKEHTFVAGDRVIVVRRDFSLSEKLDP